MKNRALKLLFIWNGVFMLAISLLGPLYAVYVEKLGNGILIISASWSVFLFSTTFFTFLVSRLGEKIRKDHLLMANYLIRAFVWLGFIFIGNIPQLIVLQIFLGLAEALGTPAFEAMFAEHIDKNKDIEEYADWELIQNIVMAIGVLLGGLIVNSFGFKYLFSFMSILAVISFLGILFKPKKVVIE